MFSFRFGTRVCVRVRARVGVEVRTGTSIRHRVIDCVGIRVGFEVGYGVKVSAGVGVRFRGVSLGREIVFRFFFYLQFKNSYICTPTCHKRCHEQYF